MSASTDIERTVAVIRALRRGTHTYAELALITAIPELTVRRIVTKIEEAGAPLVAAEREGDRGRPARTLHLTVDGLREWLG